MASSPTWHSWAPLPAALVSAWFLVIMPRSHQLSLPGVDAGRDRSCSVSPGLTRGGGFPWAFLAPCPWPFHCLSMEPGRPGMAATSAAIPACLPSTCDRAFSGSLPFLWQLPHSGKEEGASGIWCLPEWAALPSPNSKCGVGPGPVPSGTLGAAGGYFCSQAGKETRVQLPRALLCVGLNRRSEVRAE